MIPLVLFSICCYSLIILFIYLFITDSTVKTIAVLPGSGASVLSGVNADLYITGEMSHHELLDSIHQGRNVILAEHSNTERGFLGELANKIKVLCEDRVVVEVSSVDRDPVEIV